MDVKILGVALVAALLGGGIVALAGGSSGSGVEYEARIATLEAEIELLQERMETLEKRRMRGKRRGGPRAAIDGRRADPSDTSEAPWSASQARGVADGDEVASMLESDDPAVREKVAGLVREEMEAAAEQRWEERRRRRAERIEQALTEFAAAQGLAGDDLDRLTDLWADERERIGEAFMKAREDMSWGKAREQAELIREETDAAAREMLSEEDYSAWVVLREEENPRRR